MYDGPSIVIQAQNPRAAVKQFEFSTLSHFGWSPDGQMIVSGIGVIHLADGKTCSLPEGTFNPVFISNDRLIAAFPEQKGLRFYDSNCQKQEWWEVPEEWTILDVSADRGLLSVGAGVLSLPISLEALIVDPFSRMVIHRAVGNGGFFGGKFADSGKAICQLKSCWDVDTLKKIGEAPTVNQARSPDTAAHASRVLIEDGADERIAPFFPREWVLKRKVVWDFLSGKELVSWHPKSLTYDSCFLDATRLRKPYPSAISPDGNYIAEGGKGFVRLYRIEP
jgi:hypothetical protein